MEKRGMYIRDVVREQWASAGVFDVKSARLREFLTYVDEHPLECWEEFIALFRRQYYEFFDYIVPPLIRSRHPVLRTVLIGRANLSKPKERQTLVDFIRLADPIADEAALVALARRHPTLRPEMQKRKKLTPKILQQLEPAAVKARPAANVRKPSRKRAIANSQQTTPSERKGT